MIKRLQTLKIRRIQWGAIRYRRQIRLRERRRKSPKEILHRLLPKIKAILGQFGVKKLTELREDQYSAVMAEVRKACRK